MLPARNAPPGYFDRPEIPKQRKCVNLVKYSTDKDKELPVAFLSHPDAGLRVDTMASNQGSSVPHNVEQITRLAQDYEYNPNIPLKYWLRTANSLVKEVCGLFLA